MFCRKMSKTNIDLELLITLIESEPIIWDKTLENYKDTNLRTAAWREVCTVLREDFQEMEEKERQSYGKFLFISFILILHHLATVQLPLQKQNNL